MYDIPEAEISSAFAACWRNAGRHLAGRGDAAISWLKADLRSPMLEHLSFRLGNQLFFVRLEDVDNRVHGPGNIDGLFSIAEACSGHACIMPMSSIGGGWSPAERGWGLLHARTRLSIDPISLISDEPIEMTDWELHDFAVQVVRRHLEQQGREIMSSQGSPHVDPSIWFVGDRGPEWVVVRSARYPALDPSPPPNVAAIAASCAPLAVRGHFAPVSVASDNDDFKGRAPSQPLLRGHGMIVRFNGLLPAA